MSIELNKAAARRLLASYNEGPEAARAARDELVDADVRVHFPGVPEALDRAGLEAVIAVFGAAFRNDRVTVDEQIAEDERVATRWTWGFTHHGDFEGIAATGRRVTISGVNMERFQDGRLVERWVMFDQAGLLRQLSASDTGARVSEGSTAPG